VRMTVTGRVDPDAIAEAERSIAEATGLSAEVRIRAVVDDSEISQMALTGPVVDQLETIESLRRDLLHRLEKPIRALWPQEQARLTSYGVRLDQKGAAIVAHYEPRDNQQLEAAAETILLRGLREWLDAPEITLSLIHTDSAEVGRAK